MRGAIAELFASKKFLVMLTAVVVYVTGRFGLDMPVDAADKLLALVATWLIGQSVTDIGKSAAMATTATPTDTPKSP